MKLFLSAFAILLSLVLMNGTALADAPYMHKTGMAYNTYSISAEEPFEVTVTTETDMCNGVAIFGDFHQLPAMEGPGYEHYQIWLAQFSDISTLMGCGTEGTRTFTAHKSLRLVPKVGGQHYLFMVPTNFKLEIKK